MSRPPRSIRVPLNVDAQFRLAVGPVLLPVRSPLLVAAAVSPVAYLLLALRLPGLWGAALGRSSCSLWPRRSGCRSGRACGSARTSSTARRGGCCRRRSPGARAAHARVRDVDGSVHVSDERRGASPRRWVPRRWRPLLSVPSPATDAGRIAASRSGRPPRRARVSAGPPVSLGSDAYLELVPPRSSAGWATVDCPAQFLTLMTHHDAERVGEAFDRRVSGWPRTPLRELERAAGEHAGGVDARPAPRRRARPAVGRRRRRAHICATPWRAARAAPSHGGGCAPGLAVRAAHRGGVRHRRARRRSRRHGRCCSPTRALGASRAMVGDEVLHIGGRHHVVLTTTRLPAMHRGRRGRRRHDAARTPSACASLHVVPVAPGVAQRDLHRRSSMLAHAERQGADPVEAQVALQDTTDVVAGLAQRDIRPVPGRADRSPSRTARATARASAAERLGAVLGRARLSDHGGERPGFLPRLPLAPGCPPLARSLVLTSDSVAARMLPCLGTPFADVDAPLLGVNVLNGTPAHFSVWAQPNHNLVVVGSSGRGQVGRGQDAAGASRHGERRGRGHRPRLRIPAR